MTFNKNNIIIRLMSDLSEDDDENADEAFDPLNEGWGSNVRMPWYICIQMNYNELPPLTVPDHDDYDVYHVND